jgi:hypothetical protein
MPRASQAETIEHVAMRIVRILLWLKPHIRLAVLDRARVVMEEGNAEQ